jgi:hypothetical protein
VQLFRFPVESLLLRLLRPLACRFVELFVLLWGEPRPMGDFGRRTVGFREIGKSVEPTVAASSVSGSRATEMGITVAVGRACSTSRWRVLAAFRSIGKMKR